LPDFCVGIVQNYALSLFGTLPNAASCGLPVNTGAIAKLCHMALGERGRNPLMARSTAENMCALRSIAAFERDPAVRCPDDMAAAFLGGLNVTTLAKHRLTRRLLLYGMNRRVPGLYTYEIMRVKFVDDTILDAVRAGLDELILLGAGLDSRPYRLAEQLRGVHVIEVDHPASQKSKRARLRQIRGYDPEYVTFSESDFTHDDLDRVLAAAGHEHSARSLFVWTGVSPYLPEATVVGLLSWVGAHSHARIIFDACWSGVIDGSRRYRGADAWRKAVARMGEPLRWGIPENEVRETLARCGLQLERMLTGKEGRVVYLKRSDGTLHHEPMECFILICACGVGAK
jgi:methyltransferase (TIGR00027 family)